jgi:hypothetical protein
VEEVKSIKRFFFAVRMISWLHSLHMYFFSKRYDALVSHWANALGEVVLESSVHVYVGLLKYVHTITVLQ